MEWRAVYLSACPLHNGSIQLSTSKFQTQYNTPTIGKIYIQIYPSAPIHKAKKSISHAQVLAQHNVYIYSYMWLLYAPRIYHT